MVISPAAGSKIVLNGAANRDPFVLNISFLHRFELVLVGFDLFGLVKLLSWHFS